MSLSRDELAARFAVALVGAGRSIGAVEEAFRQADTFLSALASAPHVPKVGDVVALTVDVVTGDRLPYRDSLDAHLYRVVHEPRNAAGLYECVRVDGRDTMTPCFISAGGMRLADAAERKAAGLPVDEAPPPAESWGASESGRMYGDMSPAPAPTVAPLTVEERRDLINVLWDRMSYNDATVAADAAAEWFAKRGGAK